MINKGLFSKLYIDDVRSKLKLDDQGEGRMATLSQAWNDKESTSLESLWESFVKKALGYLEFVPPASPPNDRGLLPLYDDWDFANCVSVLCLVGPQEDIDDKRLGRFWPGKLIGELKRKKLHWGILTDGACWRLYSTKSSKPFEDYVELDLAASLHNHDEQEYSLFEHFFHADSFMAEEADDKEEADKEKAAGVYKCQLDRKREESESTLEIKVKSPFLFQVDEVLQYLCNGFIHDTRKSGEEYTEEERREIFESAVKLLYRCLFLFYAESRSLLPSEQAKEQEYGERSIRALCREAHKFRWGNREDHEEYGMWKHLKGLTNAVNDGDPDYGIIGYNGGLFDDEEEHFLGHHRVRNDFLARALYLLAFVEPADADPKNEYEIPYEDLEVRHLGELYENILEFNVTLADADRVRRRIKNGIEILLLSETEVKKGDTVIKKGDVYFGETALERKQSGSYYTPESLVHFLNNKAIVQPLTDRFDRHRERFAEFLKQVDKGYDQSIRRGALQSAVAQVERFVQEDVLNFKVCDPAMGSGHFLVNAANQMTEYVIGLFDELPQGEESEAAVNCDPNFWRRLITRHCLYGVDINPLSTHLAKLSLWLNCFARDHKLTFLDHHLRCGNSLIGVRTFQQLQNVPLRNNERKKKSAQPISLPFASDLEDRLNNAAQTIADIARIDEDDTDRQKDLFDEAYNAAVEYIAPLADLHTAYLMDNSITKDDYWTLFRTITKGDIDTINNNLELYRIWKRINTLQSRHDFFHWMLEFPDVFSGSVVLGFDATVGNPPWDVLQPNTKEFYINYDPNFKKYKKPQAVSVIEQLHLQYPNIATRWKDYELSIKEASVYFKELSAYTCLQKGKIDLYKGFLEQFFLLLKEGGRMGIIVPSGMYTDHSCQILREHFFSNSKIDFIYCFENRWPSVFNAVDGRFKFVTFSTLKGNTTESFKCAFMKHNPEKLPLIEKNSLKMSLSNIRKFSPETLSIVEFKTQKSIDLTTKIYGEQIVLGENSKDKWNVELSQEFNRSSDSHLFNTHGGGCPLYEGKNIWSFDCQFEPISLWMEKQLVLDDEYNTRWRVLKKKNISPEIYDHEQYRACFRNIAASTNERTLISTIIPKNGICPHTNIVVRRFRQNPLDGQPIENMSISQSLFLVSIFNSFVCDFVIRQKITNHLDMHFIYTLPIPRLDEQCDNFTKEYFVNIISRSLRLLCTSDDFADLWEELFLLDWASPFFWYSKNVSINTYGPKHEQDTRSRLRDEASSLTKEWVPQCGVHDRLPDRRDTGDRAQLRAEIDAYVAHLYGLSRDDFGYILDTFPVLKRKEEKAFGEFMSKRKSLEEYDRIA